MLMLFILSGCAGGRATFSKAEKLESEGNLDDALVKYAEVALANPDMGEYRVRFLKVSESASRAHYKKGEDFLEKNKYDDALREFQTAYAIDPSQEIAKQQSDKVIKLRNSVIFYQEGVEFEKNRKLREALNSYQKAIEFNPANNDAKQASERLLKSKKSKLGGFDLNLKSTKPITLKFKDAKIKEVFSIISQLSGINFIFDEGVKDQNISIFLENATFQQALEIITGINKLGKKVLNESTIIVYSKTPEKEKQYEELFVQTFYLNKLDAKKAVNLIRTMLQVKKIYVNEEMNALVIRDSREAIEVARKILEANDVPDAEVLLEVEVVELSKKNEEKFGLALSRYATTLNVRTPGNEFFSDTFNPVNTSSGSTTTPTTPANLLNLFSYKGYNGFITVPSATFNFGKSLANGETLSNPKIRVKNREKAKFNVGTRVPITTTSSPTGGGVSVNVQYVDVGVKVNAEPTIQLNNDVSIKLGLEVSSILQREAVGSDQATTVVTIGTRNLDTVLSLKDGETSIIGGLIQDIKSNNKDKIFLLGDIPFLGALFSNQNKSNDKTELLLAITPRIIRGITVPDGDASAFWSGREDDPSVATPYSSFIQEPEIELIPAAGTSPAAPGQQTNASGSVEKATPVAAGATALPSSATVAPVTPVVPLAGGVSVKSPMVGQSSAKTTVNIYSPANVQVNQQFTIQIIADAAKNLYGAPFVLDYDPTILEFISMAEGELLKQDNVSTDFLFNVDKGAGQIEIMLSRIGDAGGVSGSGTLVTATFRPLRKGMASIGFADANFTSPGGGPVEVVSSGVGIEVK
jgi:general secretion pathway protein D